MKNIFFVDKTSVAVSTEDETGKSLLESQVNSMVSGIGNFLNFDCILTYNENFDDNYRNEYVNTIKTMKYSNKIIGNYTNSQIKLIIDKMYS